MKEIAINIPINSNDEAMEYAFTLAQKAYSLDEVPVGAVVVFANKIIGFGYNQTITNLSPTAHAEILAINMAAKTINNYRLINCQLFVTLEPCVMCMGAIISSRIAQVHFSLNDPKTGACGGAINLSLPENKLNFHCEFNKGLHAEKSKLLLQSFFSNKRKK